MGPSRICALALLACLAVPALAASEEARVEALERRLQELEARLAELRERTAEVDAERVAELERRIEVLAREIEDLKLGEAAGAARGEHGLGPAASKVYAVRRGVSVGGYGEMLYQNPDSRREDGAPSGETDAIDLLRAVVYLGYKFNDRILFNSEIELEHATTGEGGEEKGEVSVEFAYLDFLVRPALNARAGLVLIPMGFINELHEPPTFLGARRPFVEQRILPTTWRENGAGVFGDAGPVTYRAYVVNGLAAVAGTSSGAEGFEASGIRGGRQGGSSAAAEDWALTGRVDWRAAAGLTLGASLFTGRAGQGRSAPSGEAIAAGTTVYDLHVEHRWRGMEARALWAATAIDDVDLVNAAQGFTGAQSVGERQYGWYGEIGYDVLSLAAESRQALVPFLRYERFDTQDRVPSGFAADPANDVTVTTLGLSWKPIPNVALKADYNRIENRARTGTDQVNLAVGFLY